MSFGDARLDRALDNWLTRSPYEDEDEEEEEEEEPKKRRKKADNPTSHKTL